MSVSEPLSAAAPPRPTLRAVYDAHLGYVWNTLRRLGIAEKDRKDVAHDVFIVVSRRLSEFDPSRPIRPWLAGVAYHVALAHKRLARNARELLIEADAQDDGQSVEAAIDTHREKALVEQTLNAMTLDRRIVFIMHEIDGVAVSDIAITLGLPVNTAYSRLRLARRDFNEALLRLQACAENQARLRRKRDQDRA